MCYAYQHPLTKVTNWLKRNHLLFGVSPITVMCCMHATYEIIQPNRDQAMKMGAHHISPSCVVCMPHMKWFAQIRRKPWSGHEKNFKWPMWPWPYTFWPGNGAQQIATLWVVCASHMKWIVEIGTGLQSGHGKNFEPPVWSDLWHFILKMVCNTSPIMCCMYATYKVIFGQIRRKPWTQQNKANLRDLKAATGL